MKADLREVKKSLKGLYPKKEKAYRRGRMDNRGATLVVVVVALALLGILASIILYSTYINYMIKVTEAKANNNFYTGEMAMEEVKAGLEQEVSAAFSSAYLSIMQNYDAYDEVGRVQQFRNLYLGKLKAALADTDDPAGPLKVDSAKLIGYLSRPERAVLEITEEESLQVYTDSIQIKGLKLTYTDESGYVAVISTDIILKVPNVHFETVSALPDMLTYCIIADDSLEAVDVGRSDIVGNVYAGDHGIRVSNHVTLNFSGADTLVTSGDVVVTGDNNGGTYNPSVITVASDSSLWAQGIMVDSANLLLEGNAYVRDDLTIQGSNSEIVLKGGYYGYGYRSVGTTQYGPQESSSILINGSATSLDMAGLTKLVLAGQAYIGTRTASGVLSESEMPGISPGGSTLPGEDVRMGQSVAVKSDQLAYLVPAECIGIIGDECIGTNPVNITDYNDFKQREAEIQRQKDAGVNPQTLPNVAEVDLYRLTSNLPMKLSDYGASYQKVFYQSSGAANAWVYYYLRFDSAENANRFFVDYYTNNKASMDAYLNNYLELYTAPESFGRLNLAGNVVFGDGSGSYELTSSSAVGDVIEEYTLLAEYDGYSGMFDALSTNLSRNYAALTDEQKSKSVFHNVIDVTELLNVIAASGSSDLAVYPAGATENREIMLVNNGQVNEEGEITGATFVVPGDSTLKLVIATGNVQVDHNFNGLIIAGGKISILNGANINADPEGVSVAMLRYDGVVNCFVGSEELSVPTVTPQPEDPSATPAPSAGGDDIITTDSLVSYMNWSKQ